MNWDQLKTILWLRWRLTRNQWARGGGLGAAIAAIAAVMGLFFGFVTFVGALVIGLGMSRTGPSGVMALWLVLTATVIATLIAIPLGVLAAVRHRKASGLVISAISQVGVAVPAFLAGILLITVFAVQLGWLPANGWTPPVVDPGMFVKQLILPVLSLGLVQGAVLTRYVRSAVLDVQKDQVILTRCDLAQNRYVLRDREGEGEADKPVAKLRERLKTLKAPVYVEVIGEYVEVQGEDGNGLEVIALENLTAGKSCHLTDALPAG